MVTEFLLHIVTLPSLGHCSGKLAKGKNRNIISGLSQDWWHFPMLKRYIARELKIPNSTIISALSLGVTFAGGGMAVFPSTERCERVEHPDHPIPGRFAS